MPTIDDLSEPVTDFSVVVPKKATPPPTLTIDDLSETVTAPHSGMPPPVPIPDPVQPPLQALEYRPGEEAAAFTGSMLEGIPVLGPTALETAERLRSQVTGKPLDLIQEETKWLMRQHPDLALTGRITGSIAATLPLSVGKAGEFLLSTATRAGATGGALGALDVGARTDWDPEEMALGGIYGAGFGVIGQQLGRVAGAVGARVRGRIPWRGEQTPTVQALRQVSSKLYGAVEKAGIRLKPDGLTNILNRVEKKAFEAGLNEDLHREMFGYVTKSFAKMRGQSVSFKELDAIRANLFDMAKSAEPAARRIGEEMLDAFDDALASGKPGDLLGGFDDPRLLSDAWKAARSNWRRVRNAEMLEQALINAERSQSSFFKALKTEVRSILRRAERKVGKKTVFLNKEEMAALDKVIKAQGIEEALEFISSSRLIVAGFGSSVGYSLTGDVMAGTLLGGGGALAGLEGIRGVLGQIAKHRMRDAAHLLATGKPMYRPSFEPARAAALGFGLGLGREDALELKGPRKTRARTSLMPGVQ